MTQDIPDAPRLPEASMHVNYGGNRVRFLAPVPSGARIRAHARLLASEQKCPGQYRSTSEITVEIKGQEKPAMVAEWITQIYA